MIDMKRNLKYNPKACNRPKCDCAPNEKYFSKRKENIIFAIDMERA